jgi:hypothetical protein
MEVGASESGVYSMAKIGLSWGFSKAKKKYFFVL